MMNSTILELESVVVEGIIPEGLGNGMLPSALVSIGIDNTNTIKAAQLLEGAAIKCRFSIGYVHMEDIMNILCPFSEGWRSFEGNDGYIDHCIRNLKQTQVGFAWDEDRGWWYFYVSSMN